MCMSHIQVYSLFFIVLAPAHEIQIFRFFHFFGGPNFGHNIQCFSKSVFSLQNFLPHYYIHIMLYILKEGVRIQGENSKKFLKLQLRIRPGGF